MEAGQEYNISPIAPNTIRSIEGGLLSFRSDVLKEDNPYTIGLGRLVDTNQSINFIDKTLMAERTFDFLYLLYLLLSQ